MSTGAFVIPARRHGPAIRAVEIALLWLRQRRLVPGMALVNRIAERVLVNKRSFILPIVVVGVAEQDANAQVDVYQAGRDQFAVYDHARGDEHGTSPLVHRAVLIVAHIGVLERAPAAEQDTP